MLLSASLPWDSVVQLVKLGALGVSVVIMYLAFRLLRNITTDATLKGEDFKARAREIRLYMGLALVVLLLGFALEFLNPRVSLVVDVTPEDIEGLAIRHGATTVEWRNREPIRVAKDQRQLDVDLVQLDRTLRGLRQHSREVKDAQLREATGELELAATVRRGKDCKGLPSSACDSLQNAVRLGQKGELEAGLRELELLREAHPHSFPVEYNYGRLLLMDKRYADAISQLRQTKMLGPGSPGFRPEVYNTLGFALLMDGLYEEALREFDVLQTSSNFAQLPTELQGKVHNNVGVAYLQLDRYKDAKVEFDRAKQLGSARAEKNLSKVESILTTVEKGDEDLPGVYAVVVASAKDGNTAVRKIPEVADKIDAAPSDLRVYLAPNGRYLITQASDLNYAKAERIAAESKAHGNQGTFVTSTAESTDVTMDLARPLE